MKYSITSRKSFNSVDKNINSFQGKIHPNWIVALWGNKEKLDKIGKPSISNSKKNKKLQKKTCKRAVSFEEGMQKAEEYGALFFETSFAEEDNIQKLLEVIISIATTKRSKKLIAN